MEHASYQPTVVHSPETNAFAVWLGRALKSCHEDAVNEPLSPELLDMLPPPSKPQR